MNETIILNSIPIIAPLLETIREVILSLQWLVGGLFGLYLILVFLKWKESRQMVKILKEIRQDIKEMTNELKKSRQSRK